MKKTIIMIVALCALLAVALPLRAGYYEQGRHYYIHKNYEKAKEMFLKAADPGGAGDAYYFLGEIERLQGNYREAEDYYKTAITKKNISRQYLINSYWNALLMAEQRNDYDSVVSICRSMWLRTGDAAARQKIESLINKFLWTDNADAIEKYNDGIELKKSGKAAEALAKFQEAMGIDGSFLAPKFEIGMMAYNNDNLDQASGYLGEIASKIPFYAEVRLVLADIQFGRHNYRAAVDHYDKALEYGFTDGAAEYRIRIRRGTCYYNINDYANAESDIEAALKFSPKSVEAALLLSAVEIKLEKYDDALKTLQRSNAANPDNAEIQYQMGSVYYKQNDPRHAACFDKLFSLAGGKKDRPHKYAKVFIILANHYYENKNYNKTLTILKALDEKSQTFGTRLLAAKSYYGLKEYDKAIDHFEKLSLGSEDKFTLCKTYAYSGRREKAKSILAELAPVGDFLSRAKRETVLSGIAQELEAATTVKKPEPEKIEPDKKTAPDKKQPETLPKKTKTGDDASDDDEGGDAGQADDQ